MNFEAFILWKYQELRFYYVLGVVVGEGSGRNRPSVMVVFQNVHGWIEKN